MKRRALIGVALALSLSGCVAYSYKPTDNMSELRLSFAEPIWDGKHVPAGQQCHRFGGVNPKTPVIKVTNIPVAANAIVVEFSDRSYTPMENGGHGKIGYEIPKGSDTVLVPSVMGHTFELPDGVFLVSAHRNPSWDDAGAYMPPCSGGSDNSYYATVKAISRTTVTGDKPLLLGEGVIQMGSY